MKKAKSKKPKAKSKIKKNKIPDFNPDPKFIIKTETPIYYVNRKTMEVITDGLADKASPCSCSEHLLDKGCLGSHQTKLVEPKPLQSVLGPKYGNFGWFDIFVCLYLVILIELFLRVNK